MTQTITDPAAGAGVTDADWPPSASAAFITAVADEVVVDDRTDDAVRSAIRRAVRDGRDPDSVVADLRRRLADHGIAPGDGDAVRS